MTITAELVLALMLQLWTPGYSSHSAVPLEHDGDHSCKRDTDPGCRRETRAEALERGFVIARAIADEANQRDGVSDIVLATALVVTIRAESAFWRSVHIGIERGDHGRARCLVQRNWDTLDDSADVPEATEAEGWRARDLDGIGYEATRRCVAVGARLLRPAIRRCGADPTCWWCVYGGRVDRTDPRIRDRVRMYHTLEQRRLLLPPSDRELLGLEGSSS